jgi:hypothetical protein
MLTGSRRVAWRAQVLDRFRPMVQVAEGGGTDDFAVRKETPLPTPTRRIARRLTALGLVVGLAAVLVSTVIASAGTPGDLGHPNTTTYPYRTATSAPPGAKGVAFAVREDTAASAVGVSAYFKWGATVTAEVRRITDLAWDTAPDAAIVATGTATFPETTSVEFRDVPLPPGFVFRAGERYDVRFLVDTGWGGGNNALEYQAFDAPSLRDADGFDAPPFRVLDGGCTANGSYSYATCTAMAHVHIVIGGDQTPPTVDVRVADGDRQDGAFYNIASSGTDGVRLDVSAQDASGIATLTCTDADGTSLVDTTASVASIDLHDGDHLVSCTAIDGAGNPGQTAAPVELHIDQTPPGLAPAVVPNPVREGQTAEAVPHASDLRQILDARCDDPRTDLVGRHTVTCSATDGAGNSATASADYDVEYAFDGFFSPVRMDEVNRTKAGSSVPLKFSIGQYDGLDILAGGSPSVQPCGGGSATHADGRLSYDADAGEYVYVWKTDRAWSGTCRQITVRLVDGSAESVSFLMT